MQYEDVKSDIPSDEIERRREIFHDCLMDFLIDGFASGLLSTGEDKELPEPFRFLDITYGDGESVDDKFYKYIRERNAGKMQRLIESESERMFSTGQWESVKDSDKNITKTWVTMQDDKVRDNHWWLEGITIGRDEEFVTPDGDSALMPGMFTNADNNANCRCFVYFSADDSRQ